MDKKGSKGQNGLFNRGKRVCVDPLGGVKNKRGSSVVVLVTTPWTEPPMSVALTSGINSLDPERHAQWRWRGLARPISALAKSGTIESRVKQTSHIVLL